MQTFDKIEKALNLALQTGKLTQAEYDKIRIASIPAISPRQVRLWLLSLGVTEDAVKAQIATMPEPGKSKALIDLEYATEWRRNYPLIDVIGAALNLTSRQMDLGFIAASKL